MSTYRDFKEEIDSHKASDGWVTSSTRTEDIYWKLLYSGSGIKYRIPNYPDTDEIRRNLLKLSKVISAIARSGGFKIHINSGYRNKSTNGKVGGATSSQHTKGEAVDMDCNGMSTIDKAKLFLFLLNSDRWKNKIDQIIWENNGQWVHCSFKFKSGTDDIANDSSFSPRPYTRQDKVYWMNSSGKFINIWTSKYMRRTSEGGYVFFENVPGLRGIKYDGRTFDIDYSKITDATGSGLSGTGGDMYGDEILVNYGSMGNLGQNRVINLSKSRLRSDGTMPDIDEERRNVFESLTNTLIEETPPLGRDIVRSQEMFGTSILKGDQTSKRRIK